MSHLLDMQRILCVLALLTGAVVAAGTAFSSPGVGVDVGSIVVNEPLRPGSAYDLPAINVINTGDEQRIYELSVQAVSEDGAKPPEAGWFHFEPERFVLSPGAVGGVDTRIVLPASAEPGHYAAHLEAHPVAAADQSIGIAAATRLTFSIEPSSWLDALRHRVERWLDDHAPWTFILPAAAIGILVLTRLRLPFQVRIEKR